jgi:ligand-binding SRPBCC domain-containing protein
MARVEISLLIAAPAEICFDAARDLDLHQESLAWTGERIVGGRASGLIELGETVTWQARHLGVTQRMTVAITAFDRPRHFRDEMLKGAFRLFEHDHFFEDASAGGNVATLMRDVLEFESPFGPVGRWFNRVYLTGYMERLLRARNEVVKRAAEERFRRQESLNLDH